MKNFFGNDSLKHSWRRFKHAYVKNPYGYATFFEYLRRRNKEQDVISSARMEGIVPFLGTWSYTYRYRP